MDNYNNVKILIYFLFLVALIYYNRKKYLFLKIIVWEFFLFGIEKITKKRR